MSWEMKSAWEVMAGITGVAILFLAVYGEFISPIIRRRKLKHPCKAYFHIRQSQVGYLDYVLQDDKAHNVKELVLPANSEVDIEFSYYVSVPFHVQETVFGFQGETDSKPETIFSIAPFIAKGDRVSLGEYWDRHGNLHYQTHAAGRSVGSCYTKGFKIRTRKVGIYKVFVGFLTDEIDGEDTSLQVRVEGKPSTRMRCEEHWGCYIRPMIKH